MGRQPANLPQVILRLGQLLGNRQYAFRGTTSLVLQGYDFNLDDIDILCDQPTAKATTHLLSRYVTQATKWSETNQFQSYFGLFELLGTLVEVMGDWRIKQRNGAWSNPFTASAGETTSLLYQGQKVTVTTVETELKMYALMNRWAVYHKLKKLQQMRSAARQGSLFES